MFKDNDNDNYNDIPSNPDGSKKYTKEELNFVYFIGVLNVGVLNVGGMDGLHKELTRLKEIGKYPHDIIDSCKI